MQVRVFESHDMASGLKLVRKELGPDALILSTKTVKNGKLGLLGKPTIEITAAIDSAWHKEQQERKKPSAMSTTRKKKKNTFAPEPMVGKEYTHINTTIGDDDLELDYGYDSTENIDHHQVRKLFSSTRSQPAGDLPQELTLHNEVAELRNMVKLIAGQLGETERTTDSIQDPHAEIPQGNMALRERLNRINQIKNPVIKLLNEHGIDSDTATTIANFAKEQLKGEELEDSEKIRKFVIATIESLTEVQPPDFENSTEQIRIGLIGPTGVGKTTSIAKLAAHYLSNYSNSVALITIDTYRIAAVEQIKVYGEIMHLPVDVVISPDQLEDALKRHADKSLILIDTAGRSPKDTLSIQELSSFLRPDFNIEKHLVLSATTRENELLDAIQKFAAVGIDRTIFTKVDECMRTGVILNVQIQNDAPLSYIANGQRVPEDLLQITKRSVAELIMSPHQGITHE
ncbi:flagellar biosynthesis protein FlhF [Desulfosediminicola flagellatus]|uniref:flagellar biosynthesis protein FlhF n=1 Tax=Desulfosediminicola flagellatus TaxID=2569541 RepID=UPI0010ACD008|nr:flagellar biosynthesis protein FlhF [Desulfosediminicola flagellatus]